MGWALGDHGLAVGALDEGGNAATVEEGEGAIAGAGGEGWDGGMEDDFPLGRNFAAPKRGRGYSGSSQEGYCSGAVPSDSMSSGRFNFLSTGSMRRSFS
jgi:hypothetical protein